MPSPTSVSFINRLNRTLVAWKHYHPTKTYSGLSLTDLELKLQEGARLREKLREIEKCYAKYKIERDQTYREIAMIHQRIINSIKGDPEDGTDSAIYKACGYKPRSEIMSKRTKRAAALKKKSKSKSANAALRVEAA